MVASVASVEASAVVAAGVGGGRAWRLGWGMGWAMVRNIIIRLIPTHRPSATTRRRKGISKGIINRHRKPTVRRPAAEVSLVMPAHTSVRWIVRSRLALVAIAPATTVRGLAAGQADGRTARKGEGHSGNSSAFHQPRRRGMAETRCPASCPRILGSSCWPWRINAWRPWRLQHQPQGIRDAVNGPHRRCHRWH